MKRAALLAALVACGAKPPKSAMSPDDALVYVRANVGDAQVWLDGRLVGPVNAVRAGIAVDPGHHRLELRADDYFSRYVELDLGRAERRKLALELAPVLP